MTIEISLLISGISVAFAIFFGITNARRNGRMDAQKSVQDMTTVIVKLESIGISLVEIKADARNVKEDIDTLNSRLIIVEESTKSAHKRIDEGR
jgi:hypothetical protein